MVDLGRAASAMFSIGERAHNRGPVPPAPPYSVPTPKFSNPPCVGRRDSPMFSQGGRPEHGPQNLKKCKLCKHIRGSSS